jgi:hypothetical protein
MNRRSQPKHTTKDENYDVDSLWQDTVLELAYSEGWSVERLASQLGYSPNETPEILAATRRFPVGSMENEIRGFAGWRAYLACRAGASQDG